MISVTDCVTGQGAAVLATITDSATTWTALRLGRAWWETALDVGPAVAMVLLTVVLVILTLKLVELTRVHAASVVQASRLAQEQAVHALMRDEVLPNFQRLWARDIAGVKPGTPAPLYFDLSKRAWEMTAWRLSYAAERLARMCENGSVDTDFVISFYAGTITDVWNLLRPGVMACRKAGSPEDSKSLEWLAKRCEEYRKEFIKSPPRQEPRLPTDESKTKGKDEVEQEDE